MIKPFVKMISSPTAQQTSSRTAISYMKSSGVFKKEEGFHIHGSNADESTGTG